MKSHRLLFLCRGSHHWNGALCEFPEQNLWRLRSNFRKEPAIRDVSPQLEINMSGSRRRQ